MRYIPGTQFDFATQSIYKPDAEHGVYLYRFGKVQVEARIVKAVRNTLVIESRRRGECLWKRSQGMLTNENAQKQVRFLAGRRHNLL